MTRPVLTSENSIKTPMGIIYTKIREDNDYPAVYTYLLREDVSPILLSVVECDAHPCHEVQPRISVISYYDLTQDDPSHEGYLYQEDLDQYIEEMKNE